MYNIPVPRIHFKGKNLVANHHLAAPFCELKPRKDLSVLAADANVSLHDNLILHGDNLLALKALLPTHAGRVNCVYIDPPYNTGNEGWKYNDNVANPMIKEWLGREVDRDDLTRHDKWLCMMYPRLSMLHELLAEDGAIFVSIDDNEVHRLRMLMDEIFGEDGFIAQICVENDSRARQYGVVATTHEYVLVYSKSAADFSGNELENKDKKFQYEDGEGGFDLYELRNRNVDFNADNRPNLYYPFYVNPDSCDVNGLFEIGLTKRIGWVEVYPQESQGVKTVWRWQPSTAAGRLNTVLFARKTKRCFHIVKKYRSMGYRLNSVWIDKDVKTDKGTLQIKEIFGQRIFGFAKPIDLLKRLFAIAVPEDGIVLDSFAGSGTTAHAVMALNKEDGGARKFILVECEDYADSITAERVRRIIGGVEGAKDDKLRAGFGGGFSYWDLGEPIRMESILNRGELPSYEELARYVFYTATGEEWNPRKMRKRNNYIGDSRLYEVYLLYKPELDFLKRAALTLDFAKNLPPARDGRTRIVFAPVRYVDEDVLRILGIKYCQLPFEIYKMAEGK